MRHADLRALGMRTVVFAAAYALAMAIGWSTRLEDGPFALLWPSAAIAVLWVLLAGDQDSRRAAAVGVLVAGTLANLLVGATPTVAISLGTVNLVIAAVTAGLVLRRSDPPKLRSPADLWWLLFSIAVGSALGALVGAWAGVLPESEGFWLTLAALFVRNTVSVAVGVAAWMVLSTARWTAPGPLVVMEAVATGALALCVVWLVFWVNPGLSLAFLVLPVSAWVAMRFSTASAVVYTVACAVVIIWLTLSGRGAFLDGTAANRAMMVQSFVGVLLIVVLLLALYRDDQARLIVSLDATTEQLRGKAGLLEAVLDGISDGVVVVDGEGRRTVTNASAIESGLVGQLVPERSAPGAGRDSHPAGALLRRARRGELVEPTILHVTSEHVERVLSVSARPLPGQESAGTAVAVFRDVTEERRAELRLRETRDLFAGVLDAASEQSIIGIDAEGWITVFNVGAERMLGYRRAEMIGRSPLDLHVADELRARGLELGLAPGLEVLVRQARTGRTETREWAYVRNDGSRFDVHLSVSAMRGTDGAIIGFILVGSDITQRRRAERSLVESEERFRLAFDTAPVGMCIFGVDDHELGRISRVNLAMTRFTGRLEAALVGSRVQALESAESEGTVDLLLEQLSRHPEKKQSAEVAFRHLNGSVVWGALSSAVVAPVGGTPYGICLIEDVTARKDVEAELRHLALHDSLTGLPNRVLFGDRLEHALATSLRSELKVGMIVVDLDGFKEVNDVYGHAEGDDLLRAVSARLQAAVRPGDTLARLGGDEFAVVCPELGHDSDLELVATRLSAALREPYTLGSGHTHPEVTASMGIALSTDSSTAETLLRSGDKAMYEAKRHGKDRVENYDGLSGERAARHARIYPELRRGLDRDEFVMFGQPIRDVHTGRTVAVETLVRWQHPDRGILPPAEFLDVFEQTPDMARLGRRVLQESCRMAAGWQRPDQLVRVHVNVSGRQLESGVLRAEVEKALHSSGLTPEALVIELTETYASIVPPSVIRDLGHLRRTGVKVAIDDIGTGYSSLARLTELPVDLLKIDRQFVHGIGDDSRCEAVVRGVLGIGEALGLEVVAEGIEQPHELKQLREWGCQLVQGYLIGYPLAESKLDLFGSASVITLPIQQARGDADL